MSRIRALLRYALSALLFTVLLCPNTSKAQTWNQIGNLPPWTDLRCAYFWDKDHGVVGGAGVLYNYNSGIWTQGSYPEDIDTIKSLRLLDGYSLYAASGKTCVWKSSDHGVTWQKTNALFPKADDINISWYGIVGINSMGSGMGKGTTFARIRPNRVADCATMWEDTSLFAVSADGGAHWGTRPAPFVSGYSCVADTCALTYYTVSEGPSSIFYASIGDAWIPKFDFGKSANDVLEGGIGGVMYVQGPRNIWRSTSGGRTWENIGGPGFNLGDRRMFTFGKYNRWLVVMDSSQVYLWDGGPDYVPTGPMPKILGVQDITDTNCTFPQLTVNLALLDRPDTVHLHAYTLDNSTIQPLDTVLILPAGSGSMPVLFRTSVPLQQFSTAFYFRDTVTGQYECGQYRYSEDTSMVVHMPSYPKNILHVSNITDTACSLSSLTIYLDKTSNPDTVHIHAYTNDGLLIEPADTTVIVPAGTGQFSIQYHATMHPYQFAATFHFEDTVSGRYKCGDYRYVTDSSIVVHLYPPPHPIRSWLKTPLKLNACTDYRLPLVIRAPATCDSLRLDSITWWNNELRPAFDHQAQETLGPDGLDTFWITISAPTPGVFNTSFFVHATTTVVPHSLDTVLNFTVFASPDPKTPRGTAPAKLTLSNCAPSVVPFYLHALVCDSVEFTSCTVTMMNGIQYSTDGSFPLRLSAGAHDTLNVAIPPQSLNGTYIVAARAKGKYLGSSVTFDTTLQVRVVFTNSNGGLIPTAGDIDFDSLSICDSRDTTVSFINVGCDTIVVTGDKTTWQPGWRADDPSFPFSLAPNESFTSRVHFDPAGSATSYQYLSYSFTSVGGKEGTSLDLRFTAVTIPAAPAISLSPSELNFGSFTRCSAAADTAVALINSGCDSLHLTSVSVVGGSGFAIVSGGDTSLAPGETVHIQIHFETELSGAFSSAIRIHAITTHGGNAIDTVIPLSAYIAKGAVTASLSTNAIDFGTASSCDTDTYAPFTLENTGCDTLWITGGTFGSSQFEFSNKMRFPIMMLKGEREVFPIWTHLDTTGHPTTILDTARLITNADKPLAPIALQRTITYPGSFGLTMTTEDSVGLGTVVPVHVLRTGKIPKEVDEVDFAVVCDEDVLGYIDAVEGDIHMTGASTVNGITTRSFAMRPASDRDVIATLHFQSYLSKNTSTSIALRDQRFQAGGVMSPPCIASIDTVSVSGGAVTVTLFCGANAIIGALSGVPFVIDGIIPNPARDELSVRIRQQVSGAVRFELIDGLGRVTLAGEDVRGTSLQVVTLPSGVYNLRVSQGGFVQSRRVVIEH
jgi:hypothetical protein